MKTLMTTTAAALIAISGTAFAQTNTATDEALQNFFETYDVMYDVSQVTDTQRAELAAIDTSTDLTDTEIQAQIMSVLGDESATMPADEASMNTTTTATTTMSTDGGMDAGSSGPSNILSEYGFDDVDYDELTAEQRAALAAVDTSEGQSDGQIRAQIESALSL